MPSLVVGGVTIPVAISSPAWSRSDAVDRGRMFDGTFFASESGGATRDWTFATIPVTQALADTYIAALSSPAAKLCSGDILQLPTMCSPELPSGKPTRAGSGNLVVLDFMLHESQPAKVLFRYAPGDTVAGESFTRSTGAYQINASSAPVLIGVNTKRDSHYIDGVRSLLLEDTRTNNLIKSNNFSDAAYVKVNMTVAIGVADPIGGTSASTLTATGANAEAYQHPANGASLVRVTSVWIKRRTGTGNVRVLNADGSFAQLVTITGAWARYPTTPPAASVQRWGGVKLDTSGDEVDVWLCDNEDGSFATSEIVTDTVAVTRGADLYSLPYTEPPREMSVYIKFVELGTAVSGNGKRLFSIANSAFDIPLFVCYAPAGGFYRTYHDRGSTAVFSTLAVSPAFGATVEIVSRLFGDGSVDSSQSINGGASTSSALSAANPLNTVWSGPLVWLNSGGNTDIGFIALQSFKIVAGARSLVEMRTL